VSDCESKSPQFLNEAEIRELFDRLRLREMVERGELTEHVLWGGQKKRKRGRKGRRSLRGSQSEYVAYRNHQGDEIARVHQNVRPRTGKIVGDPDPKQVYHDGVLYELRAAPDLVDF
jgi:hypothetical protein